MKVLIAAAIVIAAIGAGASASLAQNDTDRALGAGAYIHPNGTAKGAWVDQTLQKSHVGAKKH